ncbi:hypothetical protein A2866_06065 [Candidatus Roizmanbacteria bacterium RIFCSPHIGHO2_01_FULL_39_8]|uniref:GIY-YIG domain-containing protein n=3 Tax=Candidatus Roizmaniibacteriota TaxID=1752723 RepID=A0A1F7GSX8_9BACT|nr:MAG: hypothetical protein A2866_06065 [Candidatus Roizmanbacteria bacterium RIFCSPHIGHO2_01_FULL_39_8]OGK27206.1 MAG: hypothetical protein A3C28_04160 [Candidatus Roizmanbacteria bacterium RIFCSPHIGHO2_02_FULL_39_9]OGK37435.1 MAG: hypothetical protein A3F60_00730 [Candidatus Roizmanbacteria bacterium RIFCSPHIGHO2_12_FULL_39_8]
MWFLYIARGKDDTLYTGITTDVKRRIDQHNRKEGAKSLRGKIPVSLVYFEKCSNQIEAAKREREIKGWKKTKKLQLINTSLCSV